MSLFDFGDFLAGEVYGAWNMAVLIFALCFPYTIFKWGLQYNITRRHTWLANSCLLLVLVVTSWGLALLKNLFFYSTHHLSHFADGAGWTLLTILVGVVTVALEVDRWDRGTNCLDLYHGYPGALPLCHLTLRSSNRLW